MTGPVPNGVSGEVLFTWSRGAKNLPQVLELDVQWVHVLGTGMDKFPLNLVGDRILTCSRGSAAVPIAEWVLLVMLMFEKQLPEFWITDPPEQWLWASLGSLSGQQLALVGFGSIGQQIAHYALSFGMTVKAIRRTQTPSPIEGVKIVNSIPALISKADHIVLAAPATPATAGIMGETALSFVKPGVHLVNVARGALVDQHALRSALDDGRIARASLDTTTPEPLPKGHWMYDHPRIRLSPHVSWNAPGSLDKNVETFADNLERWLKGDKLKGIVNTSERY